MASLTSEKAVGDQGNAAFSYAQAAKGRSPSVPHAAVDSEKPSTKRTASEGQTAVIKDFSIAQEGPHTTSTPESDATKTPPASSPGYGTASTSTLPKDDDASTMLNGSSDTTWDRQSQTSQNGVKDVAKAESGKQDSETASWADDTPPPASLRDAPPPAINFWEQRKELMWAKGRAAKPVAAGGPDRALESGKSCDLTSGNKIGEGRAEAKRTESQKKAKSHLGSTDGKPSQSVNKDSKANDHTPRNGAEGLNKTNPKARVPESNKPNDSAPVSLPPPGDAVSWPTPDSAQDEEKKRTQERAEKADKDKTTASKPSAKKEWQPMPFVPSAVFNTPIPQARRGGGGRPNRGSREAGQGRGGPMPQTTNGQEKSSIGAPGSAVGQSVATSNESSRAELPETQVASTTSKSKRSASAGPPIEQEQRKAGESISIERRKEAETKASRSGINHTSSRPGFDSISTSTQTENAGNSESTARPAAWDAHPMNGKVFRDETERVDRRHSRLPDTEQHSRPSGAEKRYDLPSRPVDGSKDIYSTSVRERSEMPRGRGGGYRNRNTPNHAPNTSSFGNTQNFVNGQNSNHQPSAMTTTKSQSAHDRHLSQSQGFQYVQSQPHPRSYRSGSRSQSIPHPGSSYGRYSNGLYAGPPNLPTIQTDLANTYGYQPGHQGIMSAMPFTSFTEQAAVSMFSMVSMQMEYYFSVDNLCKDMYLRKHMDSQGFVFLSVLLKFNRMQQLTQDIELIKSICLHSVNIQMCTGPDGIDRLRKKDGWEQWVLAREERDPSVQNDGPSHVEPPRIAQPSMFNMPFGYDGVSDVVASYGSPIQMSEDAPNHQIRDGMGPSFVPAAAAAAPITNGSTSGTSSTQTPQLGAVPDFAPEIPQTNGQKFSSLGPSSHSASSFTDEQVDSLVIVVGQPMNPVAAPPPPPFASASSRTFSNGSIDGRTISEELLKSEDRQPRPRANGGIAPDLLDLNFIQRSQSPLRVDSPRRKMNINASPPIFWVKDKDTPIDSLPKDLTHESYHVFRVNALQQREQSPYTICHRDMEILYQFWSHFLIRNFNARMYQEFRHLAFDDAENRGSTVGIKNLTQYYDESIRGDKVVSSEIAQDFVDLVVNERLGKEKIAFDKLRAAWRNGATNMKNRKKIDNIIDAELKAQLER